MSVSNAQGKARLRQSPLSSCKHPNSCPYFSLLRVEPSAATSHQDQGRSSSLARVSHITSSAYASHRHCDQQSPTTSYGGDLKFAKRIDPISLDFDPHKENSSQISLSHNDNKCSSNKLSSATPKRKEHNRACKLSCRPHMRTNNNEGSSLFPRSDVDGPFFDNLLAQPKVSCTLIGPETHGNSSYCSENRLLVVSNAPLEPPKGSLNRPLHPLHSIIRPIFYTAEPAEHVSGEHLVAPPSALTSGCGIKVVVDRNKERAVDPKTGRLEHAGYFYMYKGERYEGNLSLAYVPVPNPRLEAGRFGTGLPSQQKRVSLCALAQFEPPPSRSSLLSPPSMSATMPYLSTFSHARHK